MPEAFCPWYQAQCGRLSREADALEDEILRIRPVLKCNPFPACRTEDLMWAFSGLFRLGLLTDIAESLTCPQQEEEALLHVKWLSGQSGLDFIEVSQAGVAAPRTLSPADHSQLPQISGGSYESLAFLERTASSALTSAQITQNSSTHTSRREAIFASFAAQAKRVATSAAASSFGRHAPLIMCTGGFKTLDGIEHAMCDDGIDLIGLGRAAAADPDLPPRLLASQRRPTRASDKAVQCKEYSVTGGEWLQALVPLKLVGGSLVTLWHQMQMHRIARGAEPDLSRRYEGLLLREVATALSLKTARTFLVAILSVLVAGIACTRLSG